MLAAVPHLLSRVQRALDEAGRVAAQAAQVEALVNPAAPVRALEPVTDVRPR